MRSGAQTPEELETLLEDAFVVRDRAALAALFGDGAVLASAGCAVEARGDEIARAAVDLWMRDATYLADPRRVLQARDTALVVARHAVNVVRRTRDGTWRYAISLLEDQTTTRQERT